MSESTIDLIDNGLEPYYKQLNRNDYKNADGIGKFREFTEENGFQDDDVLDELQQDCEDCMLLDFDDNFPFLETNKPVSWKQQQMHQILNDIVAGKSFDMHLKTRILTMDTICAGITQQELKYGIDKYTSQMSQVSFNTSMEPELKYFFAVGLKLGFPFLTYIVDSFTTDKLKQYSNSKQLARNQWQLTNKFMQKLKKTNSNLFTKLCGAMRAYSDRIMNRLSLVSYYIINDEIEPIAKYLVAASLFVNKLIKATSDNTSFQVDLVIAVKSASQRQLQSLSPADNEDDGDDDELELDDDDGKYEATNSITIGNVQNKLKTYPLPYSPNSNWEIEETQSINDIAEILSKRYEAFKSVLHKMKDERFNSKTYPKNRRFCVFVDRRMDKHTQNGDDNKMKEKSTDEIAYFQPPNYCNAMQPEHIFEIGYEFITQCIIPLEKVPNMHKKNNITAKHAVRGELLTFMFNVEQKNEIRCYIVFGAQSMRFHGDHIKNLLPLLFEESKENSEFKDAKTTNEIEKIFLENVIDSRFDQFYDELTHFC